MTRILLILLVGCGVARAQTVCCPLGGCEPCATVTVVSPASDDRTQIQRDADRLREDIKLHRADAAAIQALRDELEK